MHFKELSKTITNTQNFINTNMYNKLGKPKKWFLGINIKKRIINLHPEGGKVDNEKNVINSYLTYSQSELREMRTNTTLWFGLYDNICEALGYALLLTKIFNSECGKVLRISVCSDDTIPNTFDPFKEKED